jgi:hypothetical protein
VRSESEVRWIRAKNNVQQRTVVTDWHAIIPGYGSLTIPPGTACDTGLSGSLQTVDHSAIKSLDGHIHQECWDLARTWIETIDPSPGPMRGADPEVIFAPPGTTADD